MRPLPCEAGEGQGGGNHTHHWHMPCLTPHTNDKTAAPHRCTHEKMSSIPRQRIVRERRQYNQWVATQTLEDYALRYTPERARRSSFRVGNTALGPISFLACEAIGGALTLSYGFT